MSTPHTFRKPNRPLTWLITGCSSGMGLALAREVQSYGHTLIATSRNPTRTPDLVSEIESKGGQWLTLDVDDRDCGRVIEDLEAAGRPVDVLVNNAGSSILQVIEHFTDDELHAQMESLYFGPCRLMRAALPHMRHRRYGVIVNISSGSGLEARESMGGYGAAKAALDGATKTLAKEVAQFNVRAFYVSLGTFNTNMGNAVNVGDVPLDPDYKGSVAEKTINYMRNGEFVADGDSTKAVKAIYELAVGEGIGLGRETESVLPLGRDLAARVKQIVDQWNHTMEVFGDVCNNVYVEK